MKGGFLRPNPDEDLSGNQSWRADREDIEVSSSTSFVYNPTPSWSITAQKQKLPISKSKDHILYLLEQYQVVIVVGDTGCGKSTQIPQFIYEVNPNVMVGITEPRRIAVTSLATRVAEEMRSKLGDIVGYSIRFDECFSRDRTRIKYMTEGILIREMMADPLLSQYSILMIDEAHERNASTDIVLGLLRKIIRKRSDLKLIISSATVDAEFIRDFFNSSSNQDTPIAYIITVQGRSYSVDVHYLKEPCADYLQASIDTVLKIHKTETPGDILVFLTGMDEVDHCVQLLHQYENADSSSGLKIWALPMYGSLTPHEQLKVFRPTRRGYRKVVVATNIAETSITIEGIAYVVDSCFVKLKWYNPSTQVDSLVIVPISQSAAMQRAGRAGRTRPGKCYRLCTKEHFKQLSPHTRPEMQRCDLSMAVLQLKALGINNVVRFEFPSSPPSKILITSLELLFALGGVDEAGHLTNPLGQQMSEFPLHPSQSKMLLTSAEFSCSFEIAAIVAMLQVDHVFQKADRGQANKSRAAHRQFEVSEGDLLTLLNVYCAYKSCRAGQVSRWCSTNFLNEKALRRADQLYTRIVHTLRRYNVIGQDQKPQVLTATSSGLRGDAIRKCIVSGLFPNAAILKMDGQYHTVRGDVTLAVNPTSVFYTMSPLPACVVFNQTVHTTKVFIKDITAIDPAWLTQLAPHYYHQVSVSRTK